MKVNLIMIASVCFSFWFGFVYNSLISTWWHSHLTWWDFRGVLQILGINPSQTLFFQISLLRQEHRWFIHKYFYNFGGNVKVLLRFWQQCIPLSAWPDFNLYNQTREACTTIMEKFDDMKMLKSEHNMHGDSSRITSLLYWHVVPMRQWKLEFWVWKQYFLSTTDDLWD